MKASMPAPPARVRTLVIVVAIFAGLFATHAYFSEWHSQILAGGQPLYYWLFRMVPALLLVIVFVSFASLPAAGFITIALLVLVGTISSLKQDYTGVPLRFSDLAIGGKAELLSMYLTPGVIAAFAVFLAGAFAYIRNARFRWWSLPLAGVCIVLLSSYRFEHVRRELWNIRNVTGVRYMSWDQSENLKRNGLSTYLYFSMFWPTPEIFSDPQIKQAMSLLPEMGTPVSTPPKELPDIYLVQGEAWWRDPGDASSGLDLLRDAGFQEAAAISPVYGGGTPNAEFEVLTAVPANAFAQSGATYPYADFSRHFSEQSQTLVRILKDHGYEVNVFHNYNPTFWQRNVVYQKFGVTNFFSLDDMADDPDGGWPPSDQILYDAALKYIGDEHLVNKGPELDYLITMETHGPFKNEQDYRDRLAKASKRLVAFKRALDRQNRNYVLIVFGDHLPSLTKYQNSLGITNKDPRWRRVPMFVTGNIGGLDDLTRSIADKPLYCLSGYLLKAIGLLQGDAYMLHVNQKCSAGEKIDPEAEAPIFYSRLFAAHPRN